jgi:hypothetical protein
MSEPFINVSDKNRTGNFRRDRYRGIYTAEKTRLLKKSCETTTGRAVWQPLCILPCKRFRRAEKITFIVQQVVFAGKIHSDRTDAGMRIGIAPRRQQGLLRTKRYSFLDTAQDIVV